MTISVHQNAGSGLPVGQTSSERGRRWPSGEPPPTDWLTGRPLTYDVSHQDVVLVIGPDGHERWLAIGTPAVSSPDTLPTTLGRFLNDEGRHNLASPAPGAWTAADVERALSSVTGRSIGSG